MQEGRVEGKQGINKIVNLIYIAKQLCALAKLQLQILRPFKAMALCSIALAETS